MRVVDQLCVCVSVSRFEEYDLNREVLRCAKKKISGASVHLIFRPGAQYKRTESQVQNFLVRPLLFQFQSLAQFHILLVQFENMCAPDLH